MQVSIFFISACISGVSHAAEGALLSMRDIRAHWLIMMPLGHGMQYPQLRQKILKSWERLFDGGKPTDPGRYALLWEVRKEWLKKVHRERLQ